MNRMAQNKSFRYGCGIVTVLLVLLFMFNDHFSSKELLIARYEKELAPIHIETIPGIEFETTDFYKGKLYVLYYNNVGADKTLIMENLGQRLEENGWKYVSKINHQKEGTMYYVMVKGSYLLRIFASDKGLRVNINEEVNNEIPISDFRIK